MTELRERIKTVIETEPVTLFMKGSPQFVMCGNSERALQALRDAGAPVTSVDVLPDPAIRQELSELSGWPTIPQIFIGGENVGGAMDLFDAMRVGTMQRRLDTAGVAFDRETRIDPYDLLPKWLHPRKTA